MSAAPIIEESRVLLRIGLPVVVSGVLNLSMQFVDTVMTGHAGPNELAAVASASALFHPIFCLGIGVMVALTPIVAQLEGADRIHKIGPSVRQGIWISMLLALLSMLLLPYLSNLLLWMDYESEVVRITEGYLKAVIWGLPAAYAFSRYNFLGDKHMFFWLLTNRMVPPAVFALPFFQLYSSVGLFDTHLAVALAHCLFNIPLAVWIMEGFISGVPKELDETAYVDGYSFPKFFFKIFIPNIKAGIGITAFFCFMFSWVELLLAKTLTAVEAKPIAATMTRTASTSGYELGLLAAAGVLTIIPGAIVIYFVRNYIAKGFSLGRV